MTTSDFDLASDNVVLVTQGYAKTRDLAKPKPIGRLYFPARPDIASFLLAMVHTLHTSPTPIPLTQLFSFKVSGSVSELLTQMIQGTAAHFDVALPAATSHCARIACDTPLLELGLPP